MQFLVLGPLEVIADGGPVTLPAAKQRTLLAALLVRASRTVTADGLIGALWEGQPPASAAKTLQTYVSQLRRELEHGSPGDWRTLRTVEGGYRLHVDRDRRRWSAVTTNWASCSMHGGNPWRQDAGCW